MLKNMICYDIDPGGGGGESFDAATMIGDDGNFNDAGRSHLTSGLGEGFEDYKGLDDYKTVASLAKGLAETKKAYSTKQEGMVKMLTAESTPEEVQAYRTAKGVPDAYEITRRKDAEGKEMAFDEVGTKMINDWMQSKNYSQAEAQDLMTMYDQYEEELITRMAVQQVEDNKAATDAFNTKHGNEADNVRKRAGEAMVALKLDTIVDDLEKTYPGFRNDPRILDWINGEVVPKMLPGVFHDHGDPTKDKEKKGLENIYNHKTSEQLKQGA